MNKMKSENVTGHFRKYVHDDISIMPRRPLSIGLRFLLNILTKNPIKGHTVKEWLVHLPYDKKISSWSLVVMDGFSIWSSRPRRGFKIHSFFFFLSFFLFNSCCQHSNGAWHLNSLFCDVISWNLGHSSEPAVCDHINKGYIRLSFPIRNLVFPLKLRTLEVFVFGRGTSIHLQVAPYGLLVQKLSVLWTVLKGTGASRLFQREMTNLKWHAESQSISWNGSPVALMWTGEIKLKNIFFCNVGLRADPLRTVHPSVNPRHCRISRPKGFVTTDHGGAESVRFCSTPLHYW